MSWKRAAALLGLLCCALLSRPTFAHTATLSVLVVKERGAGSFDSSWEQTQRIRDRSAAYELLKPVFPTHCRFTPPRLECGSDGLSGTVGFDGLADLSTSAMLKIEWADGSTQLLSFSAAAPHARVSHGAHAAASWEAVKSFVSMGVRHIWLGWDHLLFVLGLLWFVSSGRVLLETITAFTLAHSLTLASASLRLFTLPGAPVEAVIALSIAFLVVEAAREGRTAKASLTRRWPWLVAFAFGLLHGFGFASALSDLQLHGAELPIALLGFNLGVELGQLVFVASLLSLRPVGRWLERRLGARLTVACHYAMGTVAMFWFFERLATFTASL